MGLKTLGNVSDSSVKLKYAAVYESLNIPMPVNALHAGKEECQGMTDACITSLQMMISRKLVLKPNQWFDIFMYMI